jgi:KaiC/GvpD/RAD55 family RecA-like ATPase
MKMQKRVQLKSKAESRDFESLLDPGRKIMLKIMQALEDIPESFVVLFIIKADDYSMLLAELLKVLLERNQKGIYLTVNKPVEDLLKAFNARRIKTESVFFIDAISALVERKTLSSKNTLFLDSPTDLIELSNAFSKKLDSMQGLDFVVFDSVNTLLLYNKQPAVEKFIHLIVGKMRGKKLKGFLIAVKSSESAGFIETISQFVDKSIEIS